MFDIPSVEIFVIRVLQTGNEKKKKTHTHTHAHTHTHTTGSLVFRFFQVKQNVKKESYNHLLLTMFPTDTSNFRVFPGI